MLSSVNSIRPILLHNTRKNLKGSLNVLLEISEIETFKNNLSDFAGNSSTVAHLPKPAPFFKEHENEFMSYFPKVVKSVTESKHFSEMPDVSRRFATLIEYTVPNGEKIRGLTTIASYKMLEKSQNLTQENLDMANILGWCVELLEAAITIADDIIHDSVTRRNAPCWFRLPDVGPNACLDIFYLEHGIYRLLSMYFSKHPQYIPMTEFFHDILYKNTAGRILDAQKFSTDQLTMDMFDKMTTYKTGSYTYYFGVTLGMHLSKIYDTGLHKQVKPILMDMGKYFQIQNDIRNCYGNTTIPVKLNQDIEEGKCTWLVTRALQKANSSQRKIIENNYGKKEEKSVQAIRNLYNDLNIFDEFRKHEKQSFKSLCGNIDKIPHAVTRNLLYSLAKKLYDCK